MTITDPVALINMSPTLRRAALSAKGMRKEDLTNLLLAVAELAATDRRDITEHPFLRKAHREVKRLRAALQKHKDAAWRQRDLEAENRRLRRELQAANVRIERQSAQMREYEQEHSGRLERMDEICSEWQRQVEILEKQLDAALHARNMHHQLQLVVVNAMGADIQLVDSGVRLKLPDDD